MLRLLGFFGLLCFFLCYKTHQDLSSMWCNYEIHAIMSILPIRRVERKFPPRFFFLVIPPRIEAWSGWHSGFREEVWGREHWKSTAVWRIWIWPLILWELRKKGVASLEVWVLWCWEVGCKVAEWEVPSCSDSGLCYMEVLWWEGKEGMCGGSL